MGILENIALKIRLAPSRKTSSPPSASCDSVPDKTNSTPSGFISNTWVPAGHFYSPIADADLVRTNAERIFDRTREIAGIDMDIDAMRKRLPELQDIAVTMDFPDTETPGRRYFFQRLNSR